MAQLQCLNLTDYTTGYLGLHHSLDIVLSHATSSLLVGLVRVVDARKNAVDAENKPAGTRLALGTANRKRDSAILQLRSAVLQLLLQLSRKLCGMPFFLHDGVTGALRNPRAGVPFEAMTP